MQPRHEQDRTAKDRARVLDETEACHRSERGTAPRSWVRAPAITVEEESHPLPDRATGLPILRPPPAPPTPAACITEAVNAIRHDDHAGTATAFMLADERSAHGGRISDGLDQPPTHRTAVHANIIART